MLLEDTEIEYIDVDNCLHENKTWVEEKITDNVMYIGYKCDYCKRWVDSDDDELNGETNE